MISTLKVQDPAGGATLHLQFDHEFRVLSAQAIANEEYEPVLNWLCQWLPGQSISTARESAGEELLLTHPEWGLKEARTVESFLKEAVYRTHLKVSVTGAEVCRCRKVSRETILENLAPGVTREMLTEKTMAGSGCGICHSVLEEMIKSFKAPSKRWHGEAYTHWVLQLEDSLALFLKHHPHFPKLTIKSFQDCVVKVHVMESLNSKDEWDLTDALSRYWAEGFPEPLSVFLAFSAAQEL